MKLVEIKNSLAKLYYEPLDFPLVISDFLTIDDGNQKILAQVVSIESTTKEDTNCAILKFSLDLDESNKHSTYSGYVPALDAIVSRTKTNILQNIFSSSTNAINVGVLTNSSKIELNLSSDILNKFLYIQSDRQEETTNILNTLLDYNMSQKQKTLIIKFHNIETYTNDNTIVFGKDLKLPVNTNILNYIYENDLTGLTVEQKAIVQDILLEIEEYINTLEDGFIPFNTLLDVVNSVYESDKSTGVILFRNKLLKYKQMDIFASTLEEINALYDSLKTYTVTVFDISDHDINWMKEALNFALQNIDEKFYVLMQIDDDTVAENNINEMYQNENIIPIVASCYESSLAPKIKSFAKNLILYKPEKQQKAAASYNSFLMKLAPSEFIVSGETTYYTPLIVKDLPAKLIKTNIVETVIAQPSAIDEETNSEEAVEIIDSNDTEEQENIYETPQVSELEELQDLQELEELDSLPVLSSEEQEENSEIKNIFDESVEEEIAKDVDKMFTATGSAPEEISDTGLEEFSDVENTEEPETIQTEDVISDDDLDILEQLSDGDDLTLEDATLDTLEPIEEDNQPLEEAVSPAPIEEQEEQESEEEPLPLEEELISEDDTLEELEPLEDLEDSESGILGGNEELPLELSEEKPMQDTILESLTENNSLPGVPIYSTDNNSASAKSSDGMNITEGNIVYHEKYGRGVVEELFNYGKRTLCSIQFDNVGRRLLDPNLAELKQM